MRRNVSRVERTGQNLADLLHDRHVDATGARQRQHRFNGRKALGGLFHLLDDLGQGVALPQEATGSVVARERRLTGRNQVAQAGKARERLGLGTIGDGEVRHFYQAARDDGGLRVVTVAHTINNAHRDSDQVLQYATEFGAGDVSVDEAPKILVR